METKFPSTLMIIFIIQILFSSPSCVFPYIYSIQYVILSLHVTENFNIHLPAHVMLTFLPFKFYLSSLALAVVIVPTFYLQFI